MSKPPTLPNIDGLTNGERLLVQTIESNSKALLQKTAEVVRLLSEMQLTQRNFLSQLTGGAPQASTTAIRPRENYDKPPEPPKGKLLTKCGNANFAGCGAPIYFDRVEGKPRPFNPNGSAHRCQR